MSIEDAVTRLFVFREQFDNQDNFVIEDILRGAERSELPSLSAYPVDYQGRLLTGALLQIAYTSSFYGVKQTAFTKVYHILIGDEASADSQSLFEVSPQNKDLLGDLLLRALVSHIGETEFISAYYEKLTGDTVPMQRVTQFAVALYKNEGDLRNKANILENTKTAFEFFKHHNMNDEIRAMVDYIDTEGRISRPERLYIDALRHIELPPDQFADRVQAYVERLIDPVDVLNYADMLGIREKALKEIKELLIISGRNSHSPRNFVPRVQRALNIARRFGFSDWEDTIVDRVYDWGNQPGYKRIGNDYCSKEYETLLGFVLENNITLRDERVCNLVRLPAKYNTAFSDTGASRFNQFVTRNLAVIGEHMQPDFPEPSFTGYFARNNQSDVHYAGGLMRTVWKDGNFRQYMNDNY